MFDQHWSIELNEQPTIVQMGIGVHGNVPIERYQLEFWCLHLYQYSGELRINGVLYPIRPGYASIIPPRMPIEYRYYGPSTHLYCHFTCSPTQEKQTAIATMQDLESRFESVQLALEQAVGYWTTNPIRAKVRLWDILWQFTDQKAANRTLNTRFHPAIEKALGLIELHLNETLRVTTIAHEVGLSHNHLTRLFRLALGKTVTDYIQERRVQRAKHLLIYSSRSIKSIAIEVGISDLHSFNKTIRRALGASPSAIREHSPQGRMGVF